MARHGESKHFKRSVVTASLVIPRKKYKYYTKPLPGKHSSKDGVSMLGFLRDVVKVAKNAREARFLIKRGYVYVDGKRVNDEKYAVGFSDLVSVRDNNFLVWLNDNGKLTALKQNDKQDSKKIKVISKHKGRKGINVLFTNDARNIVYEKDDVQINDSIDFDLKDGKVTGKIPFEQGRKIIVFSGKNAGKTGVIKEMTNESVIVSGDNGEFIASAKSCMVIQ